MPFNCCEQDIKYTPLGICKTACSKNKRMESNLNCSTITQNKINENVVFKISLGKSPDSLSHDSPHASHACILMLANGLLVENY